MFDFRTSLVFLPLPIPIHLRRQEAWLAIKFHLPDGSDTDIVAHSFNGFPAATAYEFRELMIAMASSGPEVTKPTPLDSF